MKKIRILIILCLLFFISFFSCKKFDPNVESVDKINVRESFFKHTENINPEIKKIILQLKDAEITDEQLSKFVKMYGLPMWENCIITTNDDGNSILTTGSTSDIIIPISFPNDNKISAYLEGEIGSTVQLAIHSADEYTSKAFSTSAAIVANDAEKDIIKIMQINKEVFGNKYFQVTDKRLFHKSNIYSDTANKVRIIHIEENTNLQTNVCIKVTTTTNDYHCNGLGSCTSGTCDLCYLCFSSSSTSEYLCTGGNGNGAPTPSANTGTVSTGSGIGYSGGGAPSSPTNGGIIPLPPFHDHVEYVSEMANLEIEQAIWLNSRISLASTIRNYLIQNNNSQSSRIIAKAHVIKMMIDPEYLAFVVNHPEDIQTAYYAYQTEVENSLVNNPCLKSVTNTITKGKLQTLVYDLFKKEQATAASVKPKFKINFKFEEVTSLPYNAPAATQDGYAYNSPTTISGAVMTIKLNTSVLAGKSKEWITSVVLHEICHAINKAIAVNASFPNPPSIPTQAEEHTTMVEKKNPLDIFNNLMLIFPNSNSAEMKDLAIGGFADVLFPPSDTALINNLTQQITSSLYFPNISITNAYDSTIPKYKNLTKGTICN
jgi:hypothetical protein